MTVLAEETFMVTRTEANFDRACDSALKQALDLFEVEEDGYWHSIPGVDRPTCSVVVDFVKYRHVGTMMGSIHEYSFDARVEQYDGDE